MNQMNDQNDSSRKGLFSDIPSLLLRPVPFSDILDMKVPLPALLETPISLSGTAARARRYLARRNMRRRAQASAINKHPISFSCQGTIERAAGGAYCVDGQEFTISDDAWIFGEVSIGAKARICGVVQINGQRSATKITIF